MARDETARERDPLLDRRSYLRLAGTAAAAVAVAGASGSADAADHDSTSIPPDERRDDETDTDATFESVPPSERVSTRSDVPADAT